MNRSFLFPTSILAAALLVLTIAPSNSQAPAPKSSVDVLKAMKASGQELLNRQEKTLQTLDAAHKAAEQIKIFAKRT